MASSRSTRRTLVVAALLSVVVWQSAFNSPTPVAADDPTSGELIPCTHGLQCGPAPAFTSPIVVTGPEDRIVQESMLDALRPVFGNPSLDTYEDFRSLLDDVHNTFDSQAPRLSSFENVPDAYRSRLEADELLFAQGFLDERLSGLEREAIASVAAMHGVPVDGRITDWGRDEVRAFMLSRLIAIAHKPEAQRTGFEKEDLRSFELRVKAKQIVAARNALHLYNSWHSDICAFQWPASVSGNPNEYQERTEVDQFCSLIGNPLAVPPAPPSSEEFTAMGMGMAFPRLADAPDGEAVTTEMVRAATILAGFAPATVAGSIGLAVAFAATTSIALAMSTVSTAGITVASPAFSTTFAAIAGFAAAASIVGAVLIAVSGAVIIAVQIWQQIIQAEVPIKLNATLEDVNDLDYMPDIAALADDDWGIGLLAAVFAESTLDATNGDYATFRTSNPPAHTGDDPVFNLVLHTTFPGPVDFPLGQQNSIAPVDWNGGAQTAYMSDGWWVNDDSSGPPTYRLKIPYLAPGGEKWTAVVTKELVPATAVVPAHLEQTLIHVHDGHPDDSWIGRTIDYAAGGVTFTATLIPPAQNWPPVVHPQASAPEYVEGQTITFKANSFDPNDDATTAINEDPLTIDWFIEPPDVSNIIIKGSDGISSLERCYREPLAHTDNNGNPIVFGCPWAHHTGDQTTFTFNDSGDFHVHVIATDSAGAQTSEVFEVAIANAPPQLQLNPLNPAALDEGGQVTLTGSATDVGTLDQRAISVDWGDGTADSLYFPCDWTRPQGHFDDEGQFMVAPPPACQISDYNSDLKLNAAPNPIPFSFTHTYTDDAPGGDGQRQIKVSASDDDGGTHESTISADVHNVAPTLYVHCGLTEPLAPGVIDLQFCDQRYGDTSTAIPVTGHFFDPGDDVVTLSINWGDGHTDNLDYPCPSGQPCPFSSTPTHFTPPLSDPVVFFNPTHTYSSGGDFTISMSATDDDAEGNSTTTAAKIEGPAADNAPNITLTTPVEGATYTLGQHVTADYSCSDDNSTPSCIGPVIDGGQVSTTTVGHHTFTVNSQDGTGHTASATAGYDVVYDFDWSPELVSPPAENAGHAGNKMRIKFSLDGPHGLKVSRGLPRQHAVDCDTHASLGRLSTAYLSKIGYRPSLGLYYFVWSTRASWAGTCREVVLTLKDGTQKTLWFEF